MPVIIYNDSIEYKNSRNAFYKFWGNSYHEPRNLKEWYVEHHRCDVKFQNGRVVMLSFAHEEDATAFILKYG